MPALILQREQFKRGQPTCGGFYFDNDGVVAALRIDCLELPWKENLPGKSCVPAGKYKMEWTFSPAFKRRTWELKEVPGRMYIRIHAGSYAGEKISDSRGCLLPCLQWVDINGDGVVDGLSSALALHQLEGVLMPYQQTGIIIDIRNA